VAATVDPQGEVDLVVVGAGILGLAVARELLARRPGMSVTVLEREPSVGFHQTGHNSGVIHAGIYYAPGSLKAKLCVAGARAMYEFCEQHGVDHDRCGKVIVARDDSEIPGLDELERRGRENGVPGLRRLTAAELAEVEPHCRGVAALHSPNTGIADFPGVARALAAQLEGQGVTVATGAGVEGVSQNGSRLALRHSRGETRARFAVFCAGGWSDRLAVMAGASPEPRIVPFRGAYLRLRPERRELVRSLIYPCQTPRCRSSGCTSPGTPAAMSSSAPPPCWRPRATPTRSPVRAPGTWPRRWAGPAAGACSAASGARA
jgi:2-hydroxyglutarate dehydrogenase